MEIREISAAIRNSVSAVDVGKALGLNVDRYGRCSCIFHNGHDSNMKLFPGNRGFTCFVCHETGDVIKLVQQYYGTSFKESLTWLNDTFRLGLNLDGQTDLEKARRAEIALQARKEAQEFAEWKDRTQFDLYLTADKILELLERRRDENVPKTADEPWNEKFCEAIRLIPEAKRFCEDCLMKCMKEEK